MKLVIGLDVAVILVVDLFASTEQAFRSTEQAAVSDVCLADLIDRLDHGIKGGKSPKKCDDCAHHLLHEAARAAARTGGSVYTTNDSATALQHA